MLLEPIFNNAKMPLRDVILFSSLWVFTVGILIALFLKEEQTTATTTLKTVYMETAKNSHSVSHHGNAYSYSTLRLYWL